MSMYESGAITNCIYSVCTFAFMEDVEHKDIVCIHCAVQCMCMFYAKYFTRIYKLLTMLYDILLQYRISKYCFIIHVPQVLHVVLCSIISLALLYSSVNSVTAHTLHIVAFPWHYPCTLYVLYMHMFILQADFEIQVP